MPLKVRVDSLLDLMKASFDGSATRLVGTVGRWFAREFSDAHADDKLDILNCVRPTLRESGFDICDSELQEPVGCDFCEGFNQYGYGSFRDVPESRAVFRLRAPSYGFDGEMDFRVRLADYEYGFDVPVKYCPFCGRRLG